MPADLPKSSDFAHLPASTPHGGSKWGRLFTGPQRLRIPGLALEIQADRMVQPDGTLGPGTADEISPATVFPLGAGPAVSLGQFLTGGLAVYLAAETAAATLCGAALTPRQTDVLAHLRLLRGYLPLAAPTRFQKVMTPAEPPGPGPHLHILRARLRAPVSEPARLRAPVSEAARQRAPGGEGETIATRIAILPPRAREKFCLANRASLTAWLRARGVTIIEPELLKFEELAKTLAGARLLVLADPEQAGLLCLCGPETNVLEIAPEGWLGAPARYLAALFGLPWLAFLAAPPSYRLLVDLPFGSLVPLSYEIPIRDLAKTFDGLGPAP